LCHPYNLGEMSALKERVKELIDRLPEELVSRLIEDIEDMIELERAIAEEEEKPGVPLEQLLRELEAEGKL